MQKQKGLALSRVEGFTLIELIVVMAVFLFIIGGAMGIFISIIQHQKRILSEQELLNQTSYVEEYMSKALRMATKDVSGNCLVDNSTTAPTHDRVYQGYNYLLTRPINGYFTGIKFLNQSDTDNFQTPACEEFFLDMSSTPYVLKELKIYAPYAVVGDEHAVALTSTKLSLNSIRFGLDGTDGEYKAGNPIGDQDTDFAALQPRVSIVMNIQLQGGGQETSRTLQTTVSQRDLNAQ